MTASANPSLWPAPGGGLPAPGGRGARGRAGGRADEAKAGAPGSGDAKSNASGDAGSRPPSSAALTEHAHGKPSSAAIERKAGETPAAGAGALPALRARIAAIGADGGARALEAPRGVAPLGSADADLALGGGLARGGVHEVRPAEPGDAAAAAGFALACAARFAFHRAASSRPWLWVRQDLAGRETGEPYGPGLAAFGLDPARLTLVAAADARDALRAAEEALRCAALGVVLIEPWGDPKALDLTATRRLVLAAEASGVPALLLRAGAHGGPGGAATRWSVAAAPSDALPSRGNFPGIGRPRFAAVLERSRQPGGTGRGGRWIMEWNPDERLLAEPPPALARAAASADRPAAPPGAAGGPLRRAG